MSNLLKYNSVIVKESDKKIIDTNAIAQELIEKQNTKKNFAQKAEMPDEDGFTMGLDATAVEEINDETEVVPIEENPLFQEKIEAAKKQAEEILDEARTEAEFIKKKAAEDGYNEGIQEARDKAERLCTDTKNELEEEFRKRNEDLEKEYEEKKANLEPELVDTLLEVFSRVTGVMAEDKKDMILSLVNGVLRNTELSKDFLIRVGEDDYKFLSANKNLIYGATSGDFHIDICKDSLLEKNKCIIESDVGVFDCSLDIQLENLVKDIRILSCIN